MLGNTIMNMSINPRAFRDAMGCFASAVTVISTTTADGQAVGVTVNSFNSVSDKQRYAHSVEQGRGQVLQRGHG
ncbi:MAG: hypothetical protein CMM23_02715 [Rhodospirillaceae bacterium]|nr:hypothetical protein [Rhodospirillaceae bacterium]